MKRITLFLLTLLLIAASSCALAASVKLGSTGDNVTELQEMLSKLGYYSGNITGHAGEKTIEAIKVFQAHHGLEQDGVAGSATMNKIRSLIDPSYAPSSSSAGSSDVKQAQTMLKALGIYSGEVTGNIGSKTRAAISAFQKKYGLTADGELDAQTLDKIKSVYGGGAEDTKETEKEEASVQADKQTVEQAQRQLKEMGLYYGDITGNIGTKTRAAILAFQKKYGLTADGSLTQATIAKLESLYEADKEEAEEEESEEIEENIFTSLRYGSTGTAVSQLQRDLALLEYYYGEMTGHYGSKTRAAVRQFQKDERLTADGIAGRKTLAAIEAAVNRLDAEEEEEAERTGGAVLDLHWFNEKSFYNNHGVKKGNTITVMDIVTGKMFNVRVQSTGYHADVEPKTVEDTQIMCDIYGVDDPDDISFKRRAILVKANMGGGVIYTYAASMYGEPHGSQVITDNDYDGQFCIHFRHSTTSETKIEYADNQDPIDKAVNYAVSRLGMTHVTDPDDL